MQLAAKRYAEALLDIAFENNSIEECRQELASIVSCLSEYSNLMWLLRNPSVSAQVKKDIFKELFKGQIRQELFNFLMVLADKERIPLLPAILEEFNTLADKRRNILNIAVYSAFPLGKPEIEKIKEKYKSIYKASYVKIREETDKDLIGGIKIEIDGKIADGSVKSRLKDLEEFIMNAEIGPET